MVPRAFLAVAMLFGCGDDATPKAPTDSWLHGDAPEGSDLLLVTIDTLRADRLGSYGYAQADSPAMDSIADAGIRFDWARTPSPRTTPALASLMTGLWPHHHGSREVRQPIAKGTPLAAVLKEQGYRTLALSASGAADESQGFGNGFDVMVTGDALKGHGGKHAGNVTDAALALLEERAVSTDQALFLWVHYKDPHFRYKTPPDFPAPKADDCKKLMRKYGKRGPIFVNRNGDAEKALPNCSAHYDRAIAFTDREIGRLLEGVMASRRGRHGIVVVTADHGENLGEDGLYYQHGPSLNDASIRVPLLVRGSGLHKGVVDRESIRLEDLAPTLLALLGIPESERPESDGVDLSHRLREGEPTGDREGPVAYAESGSALMIDFHPALISGRDRSGYCLNGERFSLCWKGDEEARLYDREVDVERKVDVSDAHPEERRRLLAARSRWGTNRPRRHSVSTERFKLEQRPLLDGGYARALYEPAVDHAEAHDVSGANPEVTRRLGELLDGWTRELPGFEVAPISPEDEKALKALGYVD